MGIKFDFVNLYTSLDFESNTTDVLNMQTDIFFQHIFQMILYISLKMLVTFGCSDVVCSDNSGMAKTRNGRVRFESTSSRRCTGRGSTTGWRSSRPDSFTTWPSAMTGSGCTCGDAIPRYDIGPNMKYLFKMFCIEERI